MQQFALLASTSSPRPWRCFWSRAIQGISVWVFSTSVEVFLRKGTQSIVISRLLHVRGGVSRSHGHKTAIPVSSPRPWRCFYRDCLEFSFARVFSTSVEVFPLTVLIVLKRACLLHVRGGVSKAGSLLESAMRSSPRPWRCFQSTLGLLSGVTVFSTSVEVFLRIGFSLSSASSLLHVRGGVSVNKKKVTARIESSPRPWRCFRGCHGQDPGRQVFSTSVEVFLRR